MIAQHEGWDDADALNLLQSDGTARTQVKWGSNAEWKKLMEYLNAHDLREPEAMRYVEERIDIDNMFDYFILEMFVGNTDPGNIRFYKRHGEGNKWRWVWFDLDWGLFDSKNGGPAYVLSPKGMGGQHINNLYIRKVLENPDMRDKFLRRLGELFQTVLTTENITAHFDAMIAEIEPELRMHFERWATEMHPKMSSDVPKNPAGAYNYWMIRVSRAYNVIGKRPHIFWGMVQDHFGLTDAQMLDYLGPRPTLPAEEQ
jgi:hypothetical protein